MSAEPVQTNALALPWRTSTEHFRRDVPEVLVVNAREELVAVFEDYTEAEFVVTRVNGSRG